MSLTFRCHRPTVAVVTTELITAVEAGRILHRSPRTVARWAQAGRLAVVRKTPGPKGTWLFDAQAIRAVAQTVPAKRGAPEPAGPAGSQYPTETQALEAKSA